jgi:hypothetical protein
VRPLSGLTNVVIVLLLVYIFCWNLTTWFEPHYQGPTRLAVLAAESVTALGTPNQASGMTQLLALHRYEVTSTLPELAEKNFLLEGALTVRDVVHEHFTVSNAQLGYALGLQQQWILFAPYPSVVHGWLVIPGTLKNGKQVDLLAWDWHRTEGPVSWERPPRIADMYPNTRWRAWTINVVDTSSENAYQFRHYYALYLLNKWNGEHSDPQEQLRTLDIYLMKELTQRNYRPPVLTKVRLCHLDCNTMETELNLVETPP